MDRKGTKAVRVRADRQRKRRFRGNQYTVERDSEFTSASAKRLRSSQDIGFPVSKEFGYCILNFSAVFSTIASMVICKSCEGNVRFSRTSNRGLGFKIRVKCSCSDVYVDSSPVVRNAYEINRRITFVLRLLGAGREGLNLFCSLMDICQGMAASFYYICLENIYEATSAVHGCILKQAAEDEKKRNEEAGHVATHLTVSGDGTWKRRGFSSLFGMSALVEKYSNKVVDVVVKSSFCQACNLWNGKKNDDIDEYNEWYETHEETCPISHEGGAGKMEIDAVAEMFSRSREKHGVLYLRYVGDGDSETFRGVLNVNPYGDETAVVKRECVGHVEKRMGARLREAKRSNEGIGGKGAGKLTDKVIDELMGCYGLAIRGHPDSVEGMKKAIWATYHHRSSTDDKPRHQSCPPGRGSWCKWRKAEAERKLASFRHETPPLGDEVLKAIKPIYEDLSSNELLERCLGAETQSNNESLNSLIWTFAPKHLHSEAKVIEIATFLAVIIFNEGFVPILKVMNVMGVNIGQQAETYAKSRDEARISSKRRSTDLARNDRIRRKSSSTGLL